MDYTLCYRSKYGIGKAKHHTFSVYYYTYI